MTPKILSNQIQLTNFDSVGKLAKVYGSTLLNDKPKFLKDIRYIHSLSPNGLWIIRGDFNIIKYLGEKKGGLRRLDINAQSFIDMMKDTQITNVDTINGLFSWNNRRGGQNKITFRLNKFLASKKLWDKDVFVEATILPYNGSDH